MRQGEDWGLAAHNMLAAAAIAHVVIDFIDTSSCPGDDDDDSHIVSVVLAWVFTRMPAVRPVRVWVRESTCVCVCVNGGSCLRLNVFN